MMAHVPVLFNEVMEYMKPSPGKLIVDGTLGRAGHTQGFLERGAKVVGFDQDLAAISSVAASFNLIKKNESPIIYQGENLTIVHSNFTEIVSSLSFLGITKIDGVFFDLGVSSPQFDDAIRGFSYRLDAPLDMRMNQKQSLSAWDIVNTYSEQELENIIKDYGEERYFRRVASQIVNNRPIDTTLQLVEVIKKAMPRAAKEEQHPAKRTFQALRIAVNNELGALKKGLNDAITFLPPQGRIGVIAFHSLEDRIVKDFFREQAAPCICPKNLPLCICGKEATLKIVTKKPVKPQAEEIDTNRRAHSACLRIAEKLELKEVGK